MICKYSKRDEMSFGEYLDCVQLNSMISITSSEIAYCYDGMYARMLHQILADAGVIAKKGNRWVLKKEYADKGYLCTKSGNTHNVDGTSISCLAGHHWTPKGWYFVVQTLREAGYKPMCVKEVIK